LAAPKYFETVLKLWSEGDTAMGYVQILLFYVGILLLTVAVSCVVHWRNPKVWDASVFAGCISTGIASLAIIVFISISEPSEIPHILGNSLFIVPPVLIPCLIVAALTGMVVQAFRKKKHYQLWHGRTEF
jgi:hypothetical protein